jgi:hypothetical protein
MSSEKRVYSEQETSAILQKAAKMQEASAEGGAYTPGITREELERIAAEAGIDPRFVGKALENLDNEEPKRGWLNLSEEYERVIEGEVDPDDYDQIFQDLKPSQAGHGGGLRQVGRTVSMQTFYKGAMCNVEITSRKGRTRVKVKSVPFTAYFMSLHPAILIGVIAGANIGARGNALIGALTFFFSMLFGIMGFAGLVKKGHKSARLLVDHLEKRVEEYTTDLRDNLVKSRPAVLTEEAKAVEELRDMPG